MSFREENVNRDSIGRFDEKPQSEAEVSLLAALEPHPEDVLNPEATVTSLTGYFGKDPDQVSTDGDGNTVADFWRDSYGTRYCTRVVIDGSGEVLRVDEQWGEDGEMVSHDHLRFDQERHALRAVVNRDRLAFAGILTENEGAGTGVYGPRFLGGRAKDEVYDASDVSKLIRQDIKRAIEFGAIPSLDYRVRTEKFAGGQAVRIEANGIRDDQQYAEREPGYPHGRSPWAQELDGTLKLIGNQWQDDQSDTMQDYWDNRYYLTVAFPNERMQAWAAEEREKAAAKRRLARQHTK